MYVLKSKYLWKRIDYGDPRLLQPVPYGVGDVEAGADETGRHDGHPEYLLDQGLSSDPVREPVNGRHLLL